jgi:hypothetical protein
MAYIGFRATLNRQVGGSIPPASTMCTICAPFLCPRLRPFFRPCYSIRLAHRPEEKQDPIYFEMIPRTLCYGASLQG